MIEQIALSLLGRDRAWRLARRLYAAARGEKPTNGIALNGEGALIAHLLSRTGADGTAPVMIDIGANEGEWTEAALSAASRTGQPLTLHTVEAAPVAAAALRDRLRGTTVHELAVSDREGVATFALAGPTAGTNSLELDSMSGAHGTVEVALVTGAALAERIGADHLRLVKVDTEGHDFAVLTGFEPMLADRRIDVIQFEYNSRWLSAHRSLWDVFRLAERHGYRVGRVAPDHVELFDRWNPECDRFFEDNYVLVSPDMASNPWFRPMHWTASNTLAGS